MEIKAVVESSQETKGFERIRNFAIGQLKAAGLYEKIKGFEYAAFQTEGLPAHVALFYDETIGYVAVGDILVIDGTPICSTHIRVALKGGVVYVL